MLRTVPISTPGGVTLKISYTPCGMFLVQSDPVETGIPPAGQNLFSASGSKPEENHSEFPAASPNADEWDLPEHDPKNL